MPRPSIKGLSSYDPSTKAIAVRLPPDLAQAVEAACANQQITPSELLRTLIASWAYGESKVSGPDAGYAQARSMAAQIAHAALQKALDDIPDTHEEARAMLQGYQANLAGRRKH